MSMEKRFMKIKIDVVNLAYELADERRYISIDFLARRIGISTKSAGKILSRLEVLGLAKRHNTRTFELTINHVRV